MNTATALPPPPSLTSSACLGVTFIFAFTSSFIFHDTSLTNPLTNLSTEPILRFRTGAGTGEVSEDFVILSKPQRGCYKTDNV